MTGLLLAARAFHFAGGMVLVGVMAFRGMVLLPAFGDETEEAWAELEPCARLLQRLFLGAGVVVLVSGAALFWAVAAEMSSLPPAEALNRETLGTVLFQTQFGHVFQWRIGLALVLAVLMGKLLRNRSYLRRRLSVAEGMAGLVAVALTVSFAGTGHAAAGAGPDLGWRIGADGLHLLASAVWPGGLLPFALFLRQARRRSVQRGPVVAAARRFSALSLLAVGALAATGLTNSIFLVKYFSAMWTTDYGRLLCLKLFFFLLMLGFAAWNRYRLLPALGETGVSRDETASLLRRLQGFVVAEVGLGVFVVIVTAVLGTTPPPQ